MTMNTEIDLTQPRELRCFFAIDLTADAKKTLSEYTEQLRHTIKSPLVKWSKPENYHITLRFLGATPTQCVPQLIEQTKIALKTIQPFTLTLNTAQFFPPEKSARALVLGVSPAAPLIKIAYCLEPMLIASGFNANTKPLLPHLTIARLNKPTPLTLTHIPTISMQLLIDRISFFHSELTAAGSIYHLLGEYSLS